jgi:hypothetical protein
MSLSSTLLVEPLEATVATPEHRARLLIGYRRLLAACHETRQAVRSSHVVNPVDYGALHSLDVSDNVLT